MKMGVNYGLDKVRFPSPVKVGSRIRGKGELIAAEKTKDGGVQAVIRVTVEIDGEAKPACIADTISRYYRSEEHTSNSVTNAQLVCRLLLEKKNKQADIVTYQN